MQHKITILKQITFVALRRDIFFVQHWFCFFAILLMDINVTINCNMFLCIFKGMPNVGDVVVIAE